MYVCALQKFSRSCADSESLPKSLSGNFPMSATLRREGFAVQRQSTVLSPNHQRQMSEGLSLQPRFETILSVIVAKTEAAPPGNL
jgi:hypothetical protein